MLLRNLNTFNSNAIKKNLQQRSPFFASILEGNNEKKATAEAGNHSSDSGDDKPPGEEKKEVRYETLTAAMKGRKMKSPPVVN